MTVSPHIDRKQIRREMAEVEKYKKTITGTSGRLVNLNGYMERERYKKSELALRKHYNFS